MTRRTSTPKPSFDTVRAVLFVVDTTNTKPGTSGRLWFKSVAFARHVATLQEIIAASARLP